MKEQEQNEWFCDHCGNYFPAVSDSDVCPCGAVVDAYVGVALMADGHRWQPPGDPVCRRCTTRGPGT